MATATAQMCSVRIVVGVDVVMTCKFIKFLHSFLFARSRIISLHAFRRVMMANIWCAVCTKKPLHAAYKIWMVFH